MRSEAGSWRPWAALVAGAIGIWLGIQSSVQGSQPDFAALGGVVVAMLTAAIVGVLLVVAGATALFARTREVVTPVAVGGGCLLTVGAIVGAVIAPVLGLTYHPPVDRNATGQVALELAGVGQFSSPGPVPADCKAVPDSETVAWVSALDVATLRSERLNVWLTPAAANAPGALVRLSVHAEPPEGMLNASWSGPIDPAAYPSDWRAGSVGFADLRIDWAPLPIAGSWPEHLAGTLTWRCEEWQVSGHD